MTTNCQCCHSDLEFKPITDKFSECVKCGVYRNNVNLLEKRPIPRDNKTEITTQIVKNCVEKYSRLLKDLDRWYVNDGHKKSLYDVACGCGALVWYARVRGWTTGGCDVNLSHQRNAKEVFGVHLDIGFEDMLFKAQYGCFVFHHGIEHMDSPIDTIYKVLHNLQSDGIIYFQHPVMIEKQASSMVSKGHQYEWTWDAFDDFIKTLPVSVLYANNNIDNWKEGDIAPIQTWIVRKK